MLMFGLYSWLPMTYTIQARYLVDFPRDLSNLEFSLICGLCALGYYIFRSANSQKNEFRTNPESDKVKRKFGKRNEALHVYVDTLLSRPQISQDWTWYKVDYFGLVGSLSSHQLLWWLAHCSGWMFALRLRFSDPLFLCNLLCRSPATSRETRRSCLPPEIWKRLGQVLQYRQVPHHTWYVLFVLTLSVATLLIYIAGIY